MSEEKNDGINSARNLPRRVRSDNDMDVSGPRRIGFSSHSSEESRERLRELEHSVEEIRDIADPAKRDDVVVARYKEAFQMAKGVAYITAIGYSVATIMGREFPIPPEFILFCATPFGLATALRIINKVRGR